MINGATRLYAIVGDPIAQVRSPQLYTERFAAMHLDAVLVPMRIPDAAFETVFPALLQIGNLDGVLVTYPFKARAMAFAARIGASGKAVGAVNAFRREADGSWSADMFDGVGFVRGAERKGHRIDGRHVALFGAGGAGSAIAHALADAGVASIAVIEPDNARATALADGLRKRFPARRFEVAAAVTDDADLIVNATPIGMRKGDGLPGAIGRRKAGTLIGDVTVSEGDTPMLRLAAEQGHACVAGRDMLTGQLEALLAFFAPVRAEAAPAAAH